MADLLALSTTSPTTCPRGRSGESSGTSPEGRRSTGGRHPAIAAHTTNTERNMSMEDRSFLGGCERTQAPRWPDAASLDLQPLRGPRLAAIHGAIAGPGEAVRPDVVVADPPERRVRARHAELVLDVHFRPDAMAGADVLQSGAALGRDQPPLIEDAHHTPVAAARLGTGGTRPRAGRRSPPTARPRPAPAPCRRAPDTSCPRRSSASPPRHRRYRPP